MWASRDGAAATVTLAGRGSAQGPGQPPPEGPAGYPGPRVTVPHIRDIRDIRNPSQDDQGWGHQALSLISLIQHSEPPTPGPVSPRPPFLHFHTMALQVHNRQQVAHASVLVIVTSTIGPNNSGSRRSTALADDVDARAGLSRPVRPSLGQWATWSPADGQSSRRRSTESRILSRVPHL